MTETADSPPMFVDEAAEPVRAHLAAASRTLSALLRTAGTLTLEERRLIVDQTLVLLEQNYVHLPLKTAMHAVNPGQHLRVCAGVRSARRRRQCLRSGCSSPGCRRSSIR